MRLSFRDSLINNFPDGSFMFLSYLYRIFDGIIKWALTEEIRLVDRLTYQLLKGEDDSDY